MRSRAATRSPDRLLDLLEPGWTSRLRGRSLVAEVEPDTEAEVLEAVARALGAYPVDIAARRWPACLAFAVTGVAATAHRDGSPWRTWWRERGKRSPAAADVARYAQEFRTALASLGLSADTHLNDDDLLLLHTGVPDAFLGELCEALADENADVTIVEGPVELLLRHEAAEAGPLLSTCRRSLRALMAGEEPSDGGLPRRFAESFAAFRTRDRPAARRTDREWRLEVFGRGPMVRQPDGDLAPAALADIDRRLLVFDEDGFPSRAETPLSSDAVWLLHPADAAPAVGGDIRVIAYGQLPPGWSGWRLVQVDLARVAWLGEPEPGTARWAVKHRMKPALLAGAPIGGLAWQSAAGSDRWPVHAVPPSIRLPALASTWVVEVRDSRGAIQAARTVSGAADHPIETADFWHELPRPVLGVFTVRVSGPPGLGIARTVAVAQGLRLTSHPEPRLLQADGLEAAEVVVFPPPGMTAIPAALSFDPDTPTKTLELATRYHSARLAVTPPRMRVTIDTAQSETDTAQSGADTGRPPRIHAGRMSGVGRLRLELPGARRPPVLDVRAGGRVVQTLPPHRDGGYNLARLRDTVAEHSDTVLTLTHDGRRATVAWLEGAAPPADDPWQPLRARAGAAVCQNPEQPAWTPLPPAT